MTVKQFMDKNRHEMLCDAIAAVASMKDFQPRYRLQRIRRFQRVKRHSSDIWNVLAVATAATCDKWLQRMKDENVSNDM